MQSTVLSKTCVARPCAITDTSSAIKPCFCATRSLTSSSGTAFFRKTSRQSLTVTAFGSNEERKSPAQQLVTGLAGAAAALALVVLPANAEFRLPPIDADPNHCDRAFVGNTIGQANAVSDKTLDLRQCNLEGADLAGKTLSGALMSDSNFAGAKMMEAVFSKAYAMGTNLEGADFTSAVVDRVEFAKANLRNTKFNNAVITGTNFANADLTGADFEGALIGSEDVKRLCANETVVDETRDGIGCRD